MSKRKIVVEIDCEDDGCGKCENYDWDKHCLLFGFKITGLRCPACLAAEVEARRENPR